MWIRSRQVLLKISLLSTDKDFVVLNNDKPILFDITSKNNLHELSITMQDFTDKIKIKMKGHAEIVSLSLLGISISNNLIPEVAVVNQQTISFKFFNTSPIRYLLYLKNRIKI